MDTKSFVIGAACGALIFATASQFLDDDNEIAVIETSNQEASPTAIPLVEPTDIEIDRPSDSSNPSVVRTAEAENQGAVDQARNDSGASDRLPRWPGNIQGVIDAEPKDDSWAYYMEQTMLEYLSSHPAISQFEISYIECRTTVCQVKVIGYDESTSPVWQQLMYDMRQQPWSEFGQQGNSWGTVEGRLVILENMHRQQSER